MAPLIKCELLFLITTREKRRNPKHGTHRTLVSGIQFGTSVLSKSESQKAVIIVTNSLRSFWRLIHFEFVNTGVWFHFHCCHTFLLFVLKIFGEQIRISYLGILTGNHANVYITLEQPGMTVWKIRCLPCSFTEPVIDLNCKLNYETKHDRILRRLVRINTTNGYYTNCL